MSLLAPSVPVLLPFLLAVLTALAGGWVGFAAVRRVNLLGLLVAAAAVALLRRNAAYASAAYPWAVIDNIPTELRISWIGASGLLAMGVLILGATFVAAYDGGQGRGGLAGLLLMLGSSCLVVGSRHPFTAVVGLGCAGVGALLARLGSDSYPAGWATAGFVALTISCASMGAATLVDPSLASTGPVWLAGCALALMLGVVWLLPDSGSLLLRTASVVLGVPMLGLLLLARMIASNPAGWTASSSWFGSCGLALIIAGALGAVVARRLGGVLAGQWSVQVGLVVIAIGFRGPVLGWIAHAVWSSALLGIACAALAAAAGTEHLDRMLAFKQPLRRTGLVYGLAAASILGLPLLAGHDLYSSLLTVLPAWVVPLTLASTALLGVGLVPPLVACVRQRSYVNSPPTPHEKFLVVPLLTAIALLVGSYLMPFDPMNGPAITTINAPGVGLRVLAGLVIVALANRRLRHTQPATAWFGGEQAETDPGWALPWSALRRAFLLPGLGMLRSWFAVLIARIKAGGDAGQELMTQIERRWYLGVVVMVVLGVLVFVGGGVR